jgi:hypothetical protein
MSKYYVTWAPESAEAGMSFLTVIDADRPMDIYQIMERAFVAEDIPYGEAYEVYSILLASGHVHVVA